MQKYKPYIVFVLTTVAVGALSALITGSDMDIYSQILKPPLSPPTILFPVVWSLLYVLMGISFAAVYKKNGNFFNQAAKIYVVQLAVNFFWSIIFFKMRAFVFAFVWIVLLLILIVRMIYLFYKIQPIAAYLQIPYLIWVSFATYLTLAIAILN